MKKTFLTNLPILAIFIFSLSIPLAAVADSARLGGGSAATFASKGLQSLRQFPEGDRVVLGGSFVLEQNEKLEGNLFVLGGTAKLDSGSTVTGDVVLIGGTVIANGEVLGDVNVLGGLINLGNTAHISGDVNILSTETQLEEGAKIDGQVNQFSGETFSFLVPGNLHIPGWLENPSMPTMREFPTSPFSFRLNPAWDAFWWLIRSLVWAGLAVLISLFVPTSIIRTSHAAVSKPFASGGMGCFTILIAPLVIILFAITICGIPISFLGLFILWIAWGFGLIALGLEIGIRLSRMFKTDWALPVSAGVGTMLLTLIANAIDLLVPCVGWFVPFIIGMVGLGAVLLTRFGSQNYPESSANSETEISEQNDIVGESPTEIPSENDAS